jgi:hypothetical protein
MSPDDFLGALVFNGKVLVEARLTRGLGPAEPDF